MCLVVDAAGRASDGRIRRSTNGASRSHINKPDFLTEQPRGTEYGLRIIHPDMDHLGVLLTRIRAL